MPVTITHSTPADGTFSATGAAAWDATHTVSGLGTMAEQNSNNVNITGGSITGVTGVLTGLTVNSTPTSGGAAGQIMFDTGSVLQESSNLLWDNTNKKLTITGATVTTSQPVLDMTQTWNNAATTFTGLKFTITDTASNAASLLLEFLSGATRVASVRKDGRIESRDSILSVAGGTIGFGTGNTLPLSQDVFLTRRGSANLRFGNADAAAPVAQTLSVQSVVAGTSNTAGANLTITGSQGTGTGAGGSIIFQVAPAGSSGTAQNALNSSVYVVPKNIAGAIGQTAWLGINQSNPQASIHSKGAFATMILERGSTTQGWGFGIDDSNPPAFYYNYQATVGGGTYDIIKATYSAAVPLIAFPSPSNIGFSSTGSASGGAIDVILSRRGAANLRLGAADAAAPVAQTLSVQSVVAGTSNTAGANLTITGSQGTGTGAGGSIIFQVAPAGTTGTAQNALATALTITPSGSAATYQANGGNGAGGGSDQTVFILSNVSSASYKNIYSMYGASAQRWAFGNDIAGNKSDNFFVYSSSATALAFYIDGANKQVGTLGGAGYSIGFWSGTGTSPGTFDTILTRRGAANLRFGAADAAAPVAQTLSVQSVVAGTTDTAGANLTITGSQGTGTGAGGDIIFQTAAAGSSGTAQNALAEALRINSSKQLIIQTGALGTPSIAFSNSANTGVWSTATGNISFSTSGTERYRMGSGGRFFAADGIGFGQTVAVAYSAMTSSGYGVVNFSAGSGTTVRLNIGGTTSSFPAIKNSSTILQVRLADDSAYAPVEASTVRTATAYTVATLPAAGTAGRRAYVTDATAPTFLGALIGGGTVVCPVFDDGTNWVAG